MSMHLRNSRDMMTTDDAGWWVSKTPLEQKLIILSSVLFILSFCLTISVIVLDNRKPPACESTTVEPYTNGTDPSSSEDTTTISTTISTTETPTEPPTETTTASTVNPPPDDKEGKEGGGDNGGGAAPVVVTATPEVFMESSPAEVPSSRQV